MAQLTKGNAMSLEFQARLADDIPSSVPVYRLQDQDRLAGENRVERLARQLGVDQFVHETRTSEDWTIRQAGVWELGVHAVSGAVAARHRKNYLRDFGSAFDLDDETATRLALSFLEGSELLPTEELHPRAVTHLRTSGGEIDSKPGAERLLDAGVVVGRQLRDVLVDGPGGFSLVNIDPRGEVVGLRSVCRPVAEPVGEVEVREPGVAYRALEEIAGRVRGDVVVTKATFGYFEQGILDSQQYLQPAYMFIYAVHDKEVSYKSAEVVAAAEKVFEPLLGDKRFPMGRQDVRKPAPATQQAGQ
ncbi:MAG: hypothetical protein ABI047_04290 [Jatrophihabitantaceae bacterium]